MTSKAFNKDINIENLYRKFIYKKFIASLLEIYKH